MSHKNACSFTSSIVVIVPTGPECDELSSQPCRITQSSCDSIFGHCGLDLRGIAFRVVVAGRDQAAEHSRTSLACLYTLLDRTPQLLHLDAPFVQPSQHHSFCRRALLSTEFQDHGRKPLEVLLQRHWRCVAEGTHWLIGPSLQTPLPHGSTLRRRPI